MIQSTDLDALVAHIATQPAQGRWCGWEILPITGGMNNLVYRATRGQEDLAVKVCRRDARDRAGREYAALALLQELSLDLAPCPLLIERERYPLPVVVQTWMRGDVQDRPPANDAEWQALVGYFAQLHQATDVRRTNQTSRLPPAVTNIGSVAQGRAMIADQIGLIPPAERPPTLVELHDLVQNTPLEEPAGSRVALCRVDANTRNFVRRAGGWASVDWENSGWGEPAFEIVDLMTHPAYTSVSAEHWQWVAEQYALYANDPYAPAKIQTYYPLMLVWWVARTARFAYELPRGLDSRLAGGNELLAGITGQYDRYVDLAFASLRCA